MKKSAFALSAVFPSPVALHSLVFWESCSLLPLSAPTLLLQHPLPTKRGTDVRKLFVGKWSISLWIIFIGGVEYRVTFSSAVFLNKLYITTWPLELMYLGKPKLWQTVCHFRCLFFLFLLHIVVWMLIWHLWITEGWVTADSLMLGPSEI